MKNRMKGFFLILTVALVQNVSAQEVNLADSTGLAGDNFSLQGALELFKKAKSPEAFETALNNEKNSVNNLDLNEDGKTDYVKVKDIGENKSRVLVMQVDVNARETQDVAVITIEQTGDATATIQIKGAEELYGEDKLIEPMEEKTKGGEGGPDAVMDTYFVWVNVWYWPCVQYIYAPTYVYWYSPWYWDYYPTWWSPWYVRPWRVHYHACYHYQPYYHQVYEYRNYDGYALYGNRKSTSSTVRNRYEKSAYKSTAQPSKVTNRSAVTNNGNTKGRMTNEGRVGNEGKAIEPNREKANVTPNKTDNGRTPARESKPAVGNPSKSQGQERTPSKVQQPERSQPSKANQGKERVNTAPSGKGSQPSKAPSSVGRNNSQPSGGGKVAPQRSSSQPRSNSASPQRSSTGARRK